MPGRIAGAILGALVLGVAGAAGAQELGHSEAASLFGAFAGEANAQPTNDDVIAAWPAAARAKGLGGSAVAHCVADMSGVLSECQVMLERSHAGFGAALLSLAPKYRLRYAAEGKRPERADVIITATWPVFDTPPDWQVQPKPGDFSTSATPAAWRSGGSGAAVMNCLEGKLGSLYDCTVVYQMPANKGFGAMLLRFQGLLRLKPAMVGGKPVATGVNIGITFAPLTPGEVP